ncbi:MAG: carbamoyl phosphate synthase small subunit [Oscillospiraceae bacterium]|nr:carbamoyl phosphate synthase small subunit [Oscillospiraceae bacterium]
MAQKAYLVLENGRVFEGERFGAVGEVSGELVFTTSTVGYLETLTDPGAKGQIIAQTFPLIGNYGVIPEDFESETVHAQGYIVREWCQEPSNFRSEGNLDIFLKSQGVAGLCGLDTRALTKAVRDHGAMTAQIVDHLDNCAEETAAGRPVYAVTTQKAYAMPAENAKYQVAVLDLGIKKSVLHELSERGCALTVLPAATAAAEIAGLKPDGVVISNGPGSPEEYPEIVEQLKILRDKNIPTLGISLGHMLMAMAAGGRCERMKYGHRGENAPVRYTGNRRVYITVQNHGYAVDAASLPATAEVTGVNVNDGSCEAITYTDRPAFSTQFYPEGAAGPQDTLFVFDQFVQMMGGRR